MHLEHSITNVELGNEVKDSRCRRERETLKGITGWTEEAIVRAFLTDKKRQCLLQKLYLPFFQLDSKHIQWSKELLFYFCKYSLDMEEKNGTNGTHDNHKKDMSYSLSQPTINDSNP